MPYTPPSGFVPDPDFLADCGARVTVERDVNAWGLATSMTGGVRPEPTPVPGLDGVPCRIVMTGNNAGAIDGQDVPSMTARVLFPVPVSLDRTHRLAEDDPDRPGRKRYWYVNDFSFAPGRDSNRGAQTLYWAVDCTALPKVQP